jgi:hypothetical protein
MNVHDHSNLILPPGTQVVSLIDIVLENRRVLHPNGSVGVIVKAPTDVTHSYRVRFLDGFEHALKATELVMLAKYKEGEIGHPEFRDRSDLFGRVIYRCIIGSRAYGLDDEHSDIDYRGVYLPPADLHWSLYGVPEQLELEETQEAYWELQKFIVLALKANPNVLECLYTPLIQQITPLGQELLDMRSVFLSRLVYQTFNGYVMSQFKKMQSDIKNQGQVKWKHVMHLLRLLASGIVALKDGVIPVRVERDQERLLAVKRGEVPWEETEKWRRSLHRQFEAAYRETKLPERPDYQTANKFLIKARRAATDEQLP